MHFPWLEELTKKGHISEAQCADIYAGCKEIVKTASANFTPEQAAASAALAKGIKRTLQVGGGLGLLAMPLILSRMWGKSDEAKEIKASYADIAKTRNALVNDESVHGGHPEKAGARFDEVANLAPTVARNPTLMRRILTEKMHSGLTREDVNTLAMIQASYTPRYSFQQKLTKQGCDAALGEVAADLLIMTKEAGMREMGSTASKVLAHSLLLTAGPVLYGLGRGTVDHMVAANDKKEREKHLRASFASVMNEDHPDRELFNAQPEKARQAFQTLTHFSPNMAMQPATARSFIKRFMHYEAHGGISAGDVKDLTEIEKNMRGSGPSPFLKGLREGAEAAGFGKAVERSIGAATDPYTHQLEAELASNLGLEVSKGKYRPIGASGPDATTLSGIGG